MIEEVNKIKGKDIQPRDHKLSEEDQDLEIEAKKQLTTQQLLYYVNINK